jgi:cytochrome c-type biogenesis protein CcmH/NrfF
MTTGWMSDVAEVAGKLFVVAGLGGLVALILMLQRLAEWTYDDFADKALNWALWGIPAGALLMGLIPLPGIIGLLLGLLWLTAFIALPVGVLSLSKSIVLSVEHAKEHLAREQRRRDRQDEYHDALAATAPRSDSTRG